MPYIGKRFYFGLAYLLTILILLAAYKNRPRDYTVKIAMLPQEELWTIEHSRKMMDKAITPEHPSIDDEDAMLQLIIHAWQWDKNAMIRYVDIQLDIHGDPILDDFIEKHSQLIVDKRGQKLKKPDILDLDYGQFIEKLADTHHPLAADIMAGRHLWSAGVTGFIHNPLTHENRTQLIHHLKNSIKGGFRSHSLLASAILFEHGFPYKDSSNRQIQTLLDSYPSLSENEFKESFSAYEIDALQGSLYAQIKLSEFYYYGFGIEKNIALAWAWSLIAQENYQAFKKLQNNTHYLKVCDETHLDSFNTVILQKKISLQITRQQIEKGQDLAKKLQPHLYQDDYRIWRKEFENVPPQA